MKQNLWDRFVSWFQEGSYPLTKSIIIINVLTLIAAALHPPVAHWLEFIAPASLRQPWTLVTYPFLSLDPISLIFYGLWLWFVGGSLERSWGMRFFAGYFAAMSAITALGLSAGMALLHTPVPVNNYLPIAAMTVAWCMLNPDLKIYFFGIMPVLAKWMAVIEVAIIFFTYGHAHPLAGFFALSGCLASFLWVQGRAWKDVHLYSSMPVKPRQPKTKRAPHDDAFKWRDLNPFERMARARRKKQFERLMEDDDDK